MFTPPPSPDPPRLDTASDDYFAIPVDDILSPLSQSSVEAKTSVEAKRAVSRRMKWAVLTVPLVLMLTTATTRYFSHPAALDLLSGQSEWVPSLEGWRPHKRHPEPMPQAASSGVAFPTASSSSAAAPAATTAAQAVPTIPSAAPVLPTPFPQPFDSSVQANFSSVGCQNFILNMTQTPSFRQCRPFSLLSQSSEAFTEVR